MCRSIKTLRPPYVHAVGDADVRAAAPAPRNAAAFDEAVEAVAAATRELLDRLEVRTPSSTGRAAS